MDFRVRSTEFYLIQKQQNEYYQKLLNLINKSFLSFNFTILKINYNESLINFLKLIGFDDNDINENIKYSNNNDNDNDNDNKRVGNSDKANTNILKVKTNSLNNLSNIGNEQHYTSNFSNSELGNDTGKLMRTNTKALIFKGERVQSDFQNKLRNKLNVNNNPQVVNRQISQDDLYFYCDDKINTPSNNKNNNNNNNFGNQNKENDINNLIKNVVATNTNNNININLIGDTPNLQKTAENLITKNDAGFKNLFNDEISKIAKNSDISIVNTDNNKNFYNGSFISKDNPFLSKNSNIYSDYNKRLGIDNINNNFNFSINNQNSNLKNNKNDRDIIRGNNNNNKQHENFVDQDLKFKRKRSKIQKRLDKKMSRRLNRKKLVNEEDIFLHKLNFMLKEVFSCFIQEENEKTKFANIYQGQGKEKTLMSDVINEVLKSKNDISFNSEFQAKGVFTSLPNIKSKIIIELFSRRVQTYEGEVIEFYIDDITQLRLRESEKIKRVFQKFLLPNLIHEVKLGFNLLGLIIKNILSNKSKPNFSTEINNNYNNQNNEHEAAIKNSKPSFNGINQLRNNIISNNLSEKQITFGETTSQKESIILTHDKNSTNKKNYKSKGKEFKETSSVRFENKKTENEFNIFLKKRNSINCEENFNSPNINKNINNENYKTSSEVVPIPINHREHLKFALMLNEYFLSIITEFPNYSFAYNFSKAIYEFEFKPEFENFDIYETMYFGFEILKTLICLKGLKEHVKPIIQLDPNLPQYFNSDQKRLKEILLNLIDNSLKHTKKGFIKISAELYCDNNIKELSSFYYIKISVEDSGTGIEDEKLGEILSLFENNNNNILDFGDNNASNVKYINNYSPIKIINEIKMIEEEYKMKDEEKEKEIKFTTNNGADLQNKGHGLVMIKQILDKIGKGINCFSIPYEKTSFSFILDNKLIEVSSSCYDLSRLNRKNYMAAENNIYSKNRKTPLETLNGLNTFIMLKPLSAYNDPNKSSSSKLMKVQSISPSKFKKQHTFPNPKEIEKKFQKISQNFINEDLNQNIKKSAISAFTFKVYNSNKLYDKKGIMNDISDKINMLGEIIVPLLKLIKNKETKIILLVGFDMEENKILKTKLKKIYKNQMLISQRKLKVITIQDGISALLLLYFEKFILKTENQIINAVIFSDYMNTKENHFIDCFGFYEILNKNSLKNKLSLKSNINNVKIGIFSDNDDLNVMRINDNYNINGNAFIINNFYNDLHILKISQRGDKKIEDLRNGQENYQISSSIKDDSERNKNKNENLFVPNQRFDYNDLLKFLQY